MCDGVRTELITFITENQEKLYRFAVSQMKDRDAALDTLQNAIVKALENYTAIRKPEYMKTWFYRILLNECHGYMRKNSREIAFEPEQVYRMQEGEMQPGQTDFELYRQIQGLPDKLRTVIILRFYEDFSLEEIARGYRKRPGSCQIPPLFRAETSGKEAEGGEQMKQSKMEREIRKNEKNI